MTPELASSTSSTDNWNALIVKGEPCELGIRCELQDGRLILFPSSWKQQLRIADRLIIDEKIKTVSKSTPFYLERRQAPDLCQILVVAAAPPAKCSKPSVVVLDAARSSNGIAHLVLTSAQIRDHFYAPNRGRPWQEQPTWYEILGVSEASTPTTLGLSTE